VPATTASADPSDVLDLSGRRVLVTRAASYMGPAIVERFRRAGAEVTADERSLVPADAVSSLLAEVGDVDVLVANLDAPAEVTPVLQIEDEKWLDVFDALVHPLMRLVRGVLPSMLERGRGKIVAITSSTPLRPIAPVTAYASARGAQNVIVQHIGVEVAGRGVNVNAIAQNFVENPAYFPPGVLEDGRMRRWIERQNPSGRLAAPSESAELALFLAGRGSDFFHGQVIPFAGGSAVNV
jgi:2-keto-3-deoxy-L-fuconate dehydrogenase